VRRKSRTHSLRINHGTASVDAGFFYFPPIPDCVTIGGVKALRLILALAVCLPLGAVCGGLYSLDVNPIQGILGGAFIGAVMGLAFGGVESVATFLYGPKEPDE
jgi:hypothetical protein